MSLPEPGERRQLPPFVGSADALLIAELANQAKSSGEPRLLAVLTASAGDAQRLLHEIAWFAADLRVRLLPDWETLPYDAFSPHHDLISERLATLYAVTQGDCDVLLVPVSTAVCRLPPPAYLAAYTFFLKQGDRLDAERFRAQMTVAGYAHVTQVVAPGEYAIRGGLVDLFPMGSPLPYRLDLFDEQIETIKTFDADSQRTLYPVAEVRLLPAREFPLDEAGRTRFRRNFRTAFEGDPLRAGIYKDVSSGIPVPGLEYWLPLFFDETATLFDYLPKGAVLWLHGDVPEAIHAFWQETRSRYDLLAGDRTRPLLPPAEQVEVRLRLGQVLELVGRWQDAADHYQGALESAFAQGDLRAQAAAETARGELHRPRLPLRLRSQRHAALEPDPALRRQESSCRCVVDGRGHRRYGVRGRRRLERV